MSAGRSGRESQSNKKSCRLLTRLASLEYCDSNSNELERTRTNSNKLEQTRTNSNKLGRGEKGDENPMIYEEWSKSIELEQTLTPNFLEP